MAKALGVGGVFFKAKDPKGLGQWYARWLGIKIEDSFGGTIFPAASLPAKSYTVWSPFKDSSQYFEPSQNPYMINFIVDDLDGALAQVKDGGATLEGTPEDGELGRFGWFIDPEGNKVELWQPAQTL